MRSRASAERRLRPARRNKGAWVLAGALVLIAALAAAAFWISGDGPEPDAPRSEPVAKKQQTPSETAPAEAAPEPAVESRPAASATRTPQTQQPAPAESPDPGRATREVETAIYEWAAALEGRDLRSHMSFYAPNLDRYYLKRGVNRAFVQADRAQALSKYSDLSFKFSNMDIRVEPGGRRAVATFDKEWDFKCEATS